jgi:molecular chaperone DnaJ
MAFPENASRFLQSNEAMATKRCYYEVLQVDRTATRGEVDRAYRKLALRYHPDSNKGDEATSEKFKEASEAYDVLRDAEKRARYDQFGHAGVGNDTQQFHQASDIFEAFSEMFQGTGFGDFFSDRGGGRGGRRARRGADVRCDVTLTLEEAAQGVRRQVSFRRRTACEDCAGSGAAPGSQPTVCRQCGGHGQVLHSAGILSMQTTCPVCRGAGQTISDPCKTCGGSGLDSKKVSLEIDIPAGVDDGMRVRLPGEGEAGPGGGPAGDCYCFVTVKPHKLFQRDGNNLVLKLPIAYTQAVLGAEIEVPTLDGRDTLRLQPGTQSGTVHQMRNRGVVDPRTGRRGDLLIQTVIEVPQKVSGEQEQVLRRLADLEHGSVLPERKSFLEKLRDFFDPDDDAETDEK